MNALVETVEARMQELGLEFMAVGLESFLESQSREDKTLVESLAELMELESVPRKERAARSRLKLSGMPAVKRLEDFDLNWLKGGLTARRPNLALFGCSGGACRSRANPGPGKLHL